MLKASVILKNVNENCVYAIDCESDENVFFKFEGASKIFIEEMLNGKSKDEIIENSMKIFKNVERTQIEKDYEDFLQTIKDFSITTL